MHQDDGGRAFPSANELRFDGPHGEFGTSGHAGMTLRDYFAAKAMPLAIQHLSSDEAGGPVDWLNDDDQAGSDLHLAATYAYAMADALLDARRKPSNAKLTGPSEHKGHTE